jgi:hypothetical protein
MTVIQGQTLVLKKEFSSDYGTIIEDNYMIEIATPTNTYTLRPSEVIFTGIVQPVAPTYDDNGLVEDEGSVGSMSYSFVTTASTVEGSYTVKLHEIDDVNGGGTNIPTYKQIGYGRFTVQEAVYELEI